MESTYDQWAQYYDIAEGDRSIFLDFYVPLIGSQTRSALELGCGTGVITAALARRMAEFNNGDAGLRVTGLDESAEMLRLARARDAGIEWVQGDFRAPPIAGEYDLVLCAFNTLQLLHSEEDLCSTFEAVRRHLKSDGVFAFDIYQPNLEYLARPQSDRLVRRVAGPQGQAAELREAFAYDPQSRIMTLDWRLIDPRRPAAPLATMRYHLRQYFAAEVEGFLAAAGLAIIERFGDFDRSPFTDSSKKQIMLCGRAG
ncbi:MAG TPA: class I SAM-dependent methyltransferase [Stellaceae bacterium]|nr:class I SAM-dependent methyltransferase [Stellaceae bacterium]